MDVYECTELLERCVEFEEATAEKVIEEAKISASTYADIKKIIAEFAKSVRYNAECWEKYNHIFETIEWLLKREMDGLPVRKD